MSARKSVLDDGFQSYLTEGAKFVGEPGIPMLMDLKNAQIPKALVPFGKIGSSNTRQYVHFYQFDNKFSRVLTATDKYLDRLKMFDGVVTPDCSILIGQARCLQQANIHMSRAVGFYLQRHGIPVIPNVRWGDASTYDFCFLGIPKRSIVCISTHGCMKEPTLRRIFKEGLPVMLDILEPSVILVHGYMPDDVFGEYTGQVEFHRYASEFEQTHEKGGE
ncbi:MAG: DUF4417 domain-containing protein [Lachnospiraceae bacterium]|nr:DUF4417 domain-containing protein [Lachnospiraceae bacterium]